MRYFIIHSDCSLCTTLNTLNILSYKKGQNWYWFSSRKGWLPHSITCAGLKNWMQACSVAFWTLQRKPSTMPSETSHRHMSLSWKALCAEFRIPQNCLTLTSLRKISPRKCWLPYLHYLQLKTNDENITPMRLLFTNHLSRNISDKVQHLLL